MVFYQIYELSQPGLHITADWVERSLYWVSETPSGGGVIYKLDLNSVQLGGGDLTEEQQKNLLVQTVFQANSSITGLEVDPLHRYLNL